MRFEALAPRYAALWASARVSGGMAGEARHVAARMIVHRDTYEQVTRYCGVPWFVVGLIHAMEAGQSFACHLHNGDNLARPTVHVPAHRPRASGGPFTFVESAVDALRLDRLDKVDAWPIERVLFELEAFNGWGYALEHRECNTPYLWSGTQHYTCGKYTGDGVWSSSAVSEQAGAAAILRAALDIDATIIDAPAQVPAVPTPAAAPIDADSYRKAVPVDPPSDSMAQSTIGNTSVAIGGTGTAGILSGVSKAIRQAITPHGFDAAEFALQMLATPEVVMGVIALLGAAYIWFSHRRRNQPTGQF